MANLEDGTEIKWVSRYGKNGKLYQWEIKSQKQLDNLIKKYGVDQVDTNDKSLWLQW